MTLRIHDTRGGKKVAFEPLAPGKVGIYSCGITVYDLCHVGHARGALVTFDILHRWLRASGYEVRHVVQACFNGRRIVVFSGGEAKDIDGVYNEARAIRDGGGNGSIIGRNTFQRPREQALKMLDNIVRIYKGDA